MSTEQQCVSPLHVLVQRGHTRLNRRELPIHVHKAAVHGVHELNNHVELLADVADVLCRLTQRALLGMVGMEAPQLGLAIALVGATLGGTMPLNEWLHTLDSATLHSDAWLGYATAWGGFNNVRILGAAVASALASHSATHTLPVEPSKRSAFITLFQAATKSFTNFSPASSWA